MIDITSPKQKKLLKLCKLFFPEYKTIFIDYCHKGLGDCTLSNTITVIEFRKNKNAEFGNNHKDDFTIHWHNLCYSLLPKRIFEKTDDYKLSENEDIMSDWNLKTPDWRELIGHHIEYRKQHIVDYLWKFSKETIHYRTL